MEETANTFYSHIWSATKKQDESLIEEYSQATVSNLLAACNQMILCLAGFDTVFLISPRIAAEQSQQLDDEWFRGFNFTHEIVCLAAVARKIDVDPYKHLANLAYAFWKGATNIQDTKSDLVQLFSPGIKALYNLKRALLIEMAKGIDSSAISAPAQKPSREIQVSTDNESRELILVGQVIAIVAEAGQIYRGYTNSDHGIDGEIEFKDDEGRATGKRLYLQLKSDDSYLTARKRDGAEVFQIKNERWAS